MSGIWVAVLVGALIAPWAVSGGQIKVGFSRGLIEGFGVWFGVAVLTTAIVVGAYLLGGLFF